jgi:cytochrome P450
MLEDDTALPARYITAASSLIVSNSDCSAGSDTTVAAVTSFFLALLVYPDVQAKGQAEVDRVVGRDRLPVVEDAENMPYVQAIASECLRWLPVVPLGSSCLRLCETFALISGHKRVQGSHMPPPRTTNTRVTSFRRVR